MKIDLRYGEIQLWPNQPLRLRQAKNTLVRCTAGRIWITEENEVPDIFLSPGQSWRIRKNGLCLIESLDKGSIHLEEDRPQQTRRLPFVEKLSRTNRAAWAPDWSA